LNRLHPSSTRATRRALVAIAAFALLATGLVLFRDQGRAQADTATVQLGTNCSYVVGSSDFTTAITTNDTPEAVAPGGQVTLDIQAGLPRSPLELDAEVTAATATFPIPAGLTLTTVTFSAAPGTTPTFAGTGAAQGSSLVLTYQATAASTLLEGVLPVAHATFTVSPNLSGSTISWPAPSSITADLFIGIPLTATCTPDAPGTVLNTTAVSGTPTSTTTTTTTTPTDAWTALVNFILGIIRFLVCVFTGVC
jgi:hypothetical protein